MTGTPHPGYHGRLVQCGAAVQAFDSGARESLVQLLEEPNKMTGTPHPRYHGRTSLNAE